ncbi:MAG: glutaminyl-tRNA synthetase [Planctomycetota bacterium]|jgi:glutaminyl-tRNA synthetase
MAENTSGDAASEPTQSRNFIEVEIDADLKDGNYPHVHTRFPPEPNGFLHIGHAKAICTDFGLAAQYGGKCNLRFDDTNPAAEEAAFVEAIKQDIQWLGFDWEERLYFASDFFEQLYDFAVHLIQSGDAYVDDSTMEEMRAARGDREHADRAGQDSPYRDRPVQESLDLFRRMRAGEFPDGARALRAKIDMGAKNYLLRDPVLYRIQHSTHHRTGDDWCLYPTYDMAHGQCDSFEGVTHSLCSLEFRNHRELYEWLRDRIPAEALKTDYRPRQIEFARLKLTQTLVSKRKLKKLVEEGHVDGWDDPRMPTLSGMRRRGYTPESIRKFIERIGLAKAGSTVELAWLEDSLRSELNQTAQRRMAVLRPLKLTLTNLEPGESLPCEAQNNPEDDGAGTRPLSLTREVWIDRDDFRLEANRKYFRLKPDSEVRLRFGYVVRCDEVIQGPDGEVLELRGSVDRETGGGVAPADGRKVKGVIHWVSAETALEANVVQLGPLFTKDDPEDGEWTDNLDPDSRQVLEGCKLESSLAQAEPGQTFQFERVGYYVVCSKDSKPGAPVFHLATGLRGAKKKG